MYACWLIHFLITLTAISQTKALTWFDAQKECMEKNQSLTQRGNESTSFYWTGLYKKRSQWIKIIGCYATSEIQNVINKTFELSISSPPLCQERCLQESQYLFALQAKSCNCLSDSFDNSQNRLAPSNCTFKCNESGLLSTECGGESSFNVFLTDTTNLSVQSRCLSLECDKSPKYRDYRCGESLGFVCNKPVGNGTTAKSWKQMKEYCKSIKVYPIGNLTLSNTSMACMESMHETSTPLWIGIVKDIYQNKEQGQLIPESERLLIKKCMKCYFNASIQESECQYTSCNKNLSTEAFCSKKEASTTTVPANTDTNYSATTTRTYSTKHIISSTSVSQTTSIVSTDLKITGSKVSETTSFVSNDLEKIGDKSAAIIVPVIIVTLVLFVFAVAMILYVRRRKEGTEEDTNGGGRGKSPKIQSTNYSNVENHTENNYFVLQKSNPSYELAGECIVGSESPYSETEDGTYDHLGNKDARKTPVEDIYNHTSRADLSDLSDYDVTNHKHFNVEDSTYDHAGVRDSSYGHIDLHPIEETDYSVLS